MVGSTLAPAARVALAGTGLLILAGYLLAPGFLAVRRPVYRVAVAGPARPVTASPAGRCRPATGYATAEVDGTAGWRTAAGAGVDPGRGGAGGWYRKRGGRSPAYPNS